VKIGHFPVETILLDHLWIRILPFRCDKKGSGEGEPQTSDGYGGEKVKNSAHIWNDYR